MGCEAEDAGGAQEGPQSGNEELKVGPEGPESDEIRTPVKARTPKGPTTDEVEKHELTNHAQHRSWCKHCVVGRARDDPHHDKPRTEDKDVAILVMRHDGVGD